MVAEDLEGRLGVGIVCGFVLQTLQANLLEEGLHDAQQMSQANVLVHDQAFNLVELRQMSGVKCLVTEDSVDTEVLHGLEDTGLLSLLSKLVEHLRADCRGVGAKDVLLGLLKGPAFAVAEGVLESVFVGGLYALLVLFRERVAGHGVLKEEGVVHVAGGVRLRLEQTIEVPERTLHESVSRHLVETHLQEGFAELSPHFQQRVQVPSVGDLAASVQVLLLELGIFPGSSAKHFCGKLSFHLHALRSEVCALGDLVGLVSSDADKFTFLKLVESFLVVNSGVRLSEIRRKLVHIVINKRVRCDPDHALLVVTHLHPLLTHRFCEANLGDLGTNLSFNLTFRSDGVEYKNTCVLVFGGSVGGVSTSLRGQFKGLLRDDLKDHVVVDKEGLERCVHLLSMYGSSDEAVGVSNFVFSCEGLENESLQLFIVVAGIDHL